jgi:hypothetical protein
MNTGERPADNDNNRPPARPPRRDSPAVTTGRNTGSSSGSVQFPTPRAVAAPRGRASLARSTAS